MAVLCVLVCHAARYLASTSHTTSSPGVVLLPALHRHACAVSLLAGRSVITVRADCTGCCSLGPNHMRLDVHALVQVCTLWQLCACVFS